MTPEMYQQVNARANGYCECGCQMSLGARELDHFFGRRNVEESIATCWMLTPQCHYAKTRNYPRQNHWLEKFVVHARKHGYVEEAERASARIAWNVARGFRE